MAPRADGRDAGLHLFPLETELQRGYLRFAMLFAELFPLHVDEFEDLFPGEQAEHGPSQWRARASSAL
eukprot:6487758-Lingulodinium_polyedra.AAC.1